MPIGILEDAHDEYGQITGQHLNTVLEYVNIWGIDNDNGIIETTSDGPEFSDKLNDKIEKAFLLDSINVQIKIYQECVDDISTRVQDKACGGVNPDNDWDPPERCPRCVGCKFILVHILLNFYLRTLHSHLMSYVYHILPQPVVKTLTVKVNLNVGNQTTMIVRLHLVVVVTRSVVRIIAMTRIAQSNWPFGNKRKVIKAIRNPHLFMMTQLHSYSETAPPLGKFVPIPRGSKKKLLKMSLDFVVWMLRMRLMTGERW